jgi:hypothetical protein
MSLRSLAGWLAPLAYLALPNCTFDGSGVPVDPPLSNGIYCDVERPGGRRCATATDLAMGIRLSEAALALVEGRTSHIGIDDSPAALAACSGQPQAVEFASDFPKGIPKCVNCADQVGSGKTFADELAACVQVCVELFPGEEAACAAGSRLSTNAGAPCGDPAFQSACLAAGMEDPAFQDPRRTLEPVEWRDLVLAAPGTPANSLVKTGPGSGGFDAGAASVQLAARGDGYVEFTAVQVDTARAGGLSAGAGADTDPTLDGIGFAVRLSPAADVFIHESGVEQVSGQPNNVFATYTSGDRIRVAFRDNFDGTATITYSLIPAACVGPTCVGMTLRTAGPAAYPLRVDASLRTPGAVLDDVRLVHVR